MTDPALAGQSPAAFWLLGRQRALAKACGVNADVPVHSHRPAQQGLLRSAVPAQRGSAEAVWAKCLTTFQLKLGSLVRCLSLQSNAKSDA